MNALLTRAARMDALQNLTAATDRWDELTVGLFTNDVIPDENTVMADLTPCTEDGMEAQTALEVSPAFEDENGDIVVEVLSLPFISGLAVDPPVIIYGLYCLGTVFAGLVGAYRLEQPITIVQVGDGVAQRIRLPYKK